MADLYYQPKVDSYASMHPNINQIGPGVVTGMYRTQKTVPLQSLMNNVQFIPFLNALFPSPSGKSFHQYVIIKGFSQTLLTNLIHYWIEAMFSDINSWLALLSFLTTRPGKGTHISISARLFDAKLQRLLACIRY